MVQHYRMWPSASKCLHLLYLDFSNLHCSLGVRLQMLILKQQVLTDRGTAVSSGNLSFGPDCWDDLLHFVFHSRFLFWEVENISKLNLVLTTSSLYCNELCFAFFTLLTYMDTSYWCVPQDVVMISEDTYRHTGAVSKWNRGSTNEAKASVSLKNQLWPIAACL